MDPLQESQILYGEVVRCIEQIGSYMRVECPEQMCYSQTSGWHAYPGYVEVAALEALDGEISAFASVSSHTASLPLGSRFGVQDAGAFWLLETGEMLDKSKTRYEPFPTRAKWQEFILDLALSFPASAYFWGGMSTYTGSGTGYDCSGLVHALFRAGGHKLPRNAHDQYLICPRKAIASCEAGDLVFLEGEKGRMVHVMLALDDKSVLESTSWKQKGTHRISLAERLVDWPANRVHRASLFPS